jgi:hypothetical protein
MLSAVGPVGGAVFMLQSPLLLHHPEVCDKKTLALHAMHPCAAYDSRLPCRGQHAPARYCAIGGDKLSGHPCVVSLQTLPQSAVWSACPSWGHTRPPGRPRKASNASHAGRRPLALRPTASVLRQDVSYLSSCFSTSGSVPTLVFLFEQLLFHLWQDVSYLSSCYSTSGSVPTLNLALRCPPAAPGRPSRPSSCTWCPCGSPTSCAGA